MRLLHKSCCRTYAGGMSQRVRPDQIDAPDPGERADLGERLRSTAHALRMRWAGVLDPWDLSPHHARALRAACAAGSLRLNELAEKLRVAPRSVTDVVDALEGRGLVVRIPDPADRRATTVEPTTAGRTLLAEIDTAKQADAVTFFAPLSEREQEQLARLLDKLTHGHR